MGNLNKTIPIKSITRTCGTCTKCCEGWLQSTIHGHKMMKGIPCHFVHVDKGCSIYNDRPKDPCRDFKCQWLVDYSIPEWLKPDVSNVIIKIDKINGIEYLNVVETGSKLDSTVLNWLIKQIVEGKYINVSYMLDGGENYLGRNEFVNAMNEVNNYVQSQFK
jgi:hypothetical protein